MKKLFSLLLVLVLVVSCFAACGGDDETEAPAGDDTTAAPAGDDTTAAPADDDTTAAPDVTDEPDDGLVDILQEDGSFKKAQVAVKATMDFNVEDVATVGSYIAGCEGFGGMSSGGGAIKDGKLVFTAGKANTWAVDNTESSFCDVRIVEFDFTVNTLSEGSGYYVYFSLMSDNAADGNGWAANSDKQQNYTLVGKADGTFCMGDGNGNSQTFTLAEGNTYHLTFQIDYAATEDPDTGILTGFVDGEKVYSGTYRVKPNVENFFRFINTNFTGDVAFDNLVIKGLDFVDAE